MDDALVVTKAISYSLPFIVLLRLVYFSRVEIVLFAVQVKRSTSWCQ
jgi:hypothetical protein